MGNTFNFAQGAQQGQGGLLNSDVLIGRNLLLTIGGIKSSILTMYSFEHIDFPNFLASSLQKSMKHDVILRVSSRNVF